MNNECECAINSFIAHYVCCTVCLLWHQRMRLHWKRLNNVTHMQGTQSLCNGNNNETSAWTHVQWDAHMLSLSLSPPCCQFIDIIYLVVCVCVCVQRSRTKTHRTSTVKSRWWGLEYVTLAIRCASLYTGPFDAKQRFRKRLEWNAAVTRITLPAKKQNVVTSVSSDPCRDTTYGSRIEAFTCLTFQPFHRLIQFGENVSDST